MPKAKIKIVEDELRIGRTLKEQLEHFGYFVPSLVSSGEEAVTAARKNKPDLILMDIVLKGGMDGIEAAERIRIDSDVPILFATAFGDEESLERAQKVLPCGYLLKPFRQSDLKVAVHMALYAAKQGAGRRLVEKENKRLENQLLQTQKMEAVGTLAGGIAHDFNNVLSAMMGYTEVAKDALDSMDSEKISHALDQVLKGGQRARDLIKQILTFSRKAVQNRRPIEVQPVIEETMKLLRASLPVTIEISKNIRANGLKIVTDTVQLHQLSMNLCTNAAQAMQESGGILSVALNQIRLDAEGAKRFPELKPGHYMKLVVGDTGHGIDPENTKRIFEPFYTTRSKDGGTGMGLAVAHGIVKSHGGFIDVHSKPGQGATFEVWLPATLESETAGPKAVRVKEGSGESILFVDDEETLVDIGKVLLGKIGYQVTGFCDPVEALECYRERPENFDLVITDLTMPRLTGIEMAKELFDIRPDLPIILTTGYNSILKPDEVKACGIREITYKPLMKKELARMIRNVLEA